MKVRLNTFLQCFNISCSLMKKRINFVHCEIEQVKCCNKFHIFSNETQEKHSNMSYVGLEHKITEGSFEHDHSNQTRQNNKKQM